MWRAPGKAKRVVDNRPGAELDRPGQSPRNHEAKREGDLAEPPAVFFAKQGFWTGPRWGKLAMACGSVQGG